MFQFFRMRALAWCARMVPVLLPLAQVMFEYSEHLLDSFLQYKIDKYQQIFLHYKNVKYQQKLMNLIFRLASPVPSTSLWQSLQNAMPLSATRFSRFDFWAASEFCFSYCIIVRICPYLPFFCLPPIFQCFIWLLVIFSVVDYFIKQGDALWPKFSPDQTSHFHQ